MTNVGKLAAAVETRAAELRKTRMQVAQDAGIRYETLRAICRGKNRPSLKTALGIDDALQWAPGRTMELWKKDNPDSEPVGVTGSDAEIAAEEPSHTREARIAAMEHLTAGEKRILTGLLDAVLEQAEDLNRRRANESKIA